VPMMLMVLMCSLLASWVVLVVTSNHPIHITCKKQVNSGFYLHIASDVNIQP
jgi:predicted ATPase